MLSNLLPLLNEIYIAYCHRDEDKNDDSRAVAIINFINLHIKDDISLEEIAQGFYISKPSLCRIFKKATGTTVWDYIITKRLINARHLISSGVSATNACYASGFNDYSVFYRAYRKKYGCSPINGGQSLAD